MNKEIQYFYIFTIMLLLGAIVCVFAVAFVTGVNGPSWQYLMGAIGGTLLVFVGWQFLKEL